nr:MAG TPA: zonular occludens toxin [Inoviridae sp.]
MIYRRLFFIDSKICLCYNGQKGGMVMITVIDSQCGAGKTSAMIEMIKKDKLGGYIYYTRRGS